MSILHQRTAPIVFALAALQETPGSPVASGDESPPDADTMPSDDLAPPTPEQSPVAAPLQQHQQQWPVDGAIGKVPTEAALEEATWHRRAAEAEHRRRMAVSQTWSVWMYRCFHGDVCVHAIAGASELLLCCDESACIQAQSAVNPQLGASFWVS
jgi:hypothetical protein